LSDFKFWLYRESDFWRSQFGVWAVFYRS